jgi:hypothetical protein
MPEDREDKDFTEYMIRCMEGEEDVSSAIVILRRKDSTVTYKVFRQEVADTLGILRFVALAVENDVLKSWE